MGAILAGSAVVAAVLSDRHRRPRRLLQPLGAAPVVVLLVGVGLFAAALPSVLFLTGIRWIGGVRTGILMLFEPVVGVALAAVLLAEGLQPLQVVGGATILRRRAHRAARTGRRPSRPAPSCRRRAAHDRRGDATEPTLQPRPPSTGPSPGPPTRRRSCSSTAR